MSDLKSCPFCGGHAFLERSGASIKGNYMRAAFVRCGRCYARTERVLFYDEDTEGRQKAKRDAIAAWNMRCE